jgi:CheY-like chemotaxis protein
MTFLVLEPAVTIRHLLCYLLLSLGVKGIPVEDRAQAEKELKEKDDIDGAVIDIDNRSAGGRELVDALKRDPKTKDLLVIVHTVQSQAEVITGLAEAGVAGVLAKPFNETETFARLKNILARNAGPKENQRRHLRITPPADELLRLNFRVSGHPGLLSGLVRNLSMGGVGIELITPAPEGAVRPEVYIERLQFTLLGRELGPTGTVVVAQGRIIGIRFTTLSPEDTLCLARYIFENISA